MPDEVIEVSLIQLIATPEKFNGKNVSTIGFFHGGNESSAIYLSQEDALIQNKRSGIAIGGNAPSVKNKPQPHIPQNNYISVSGLFHTGQGGHGGLWQGMIYPTIAFSVYDQSSKEWRVLQ